MFISLVTGRASMRPAGLFQKRNIVTRDRWRSLCPVVKRVILNNFCLPFN